LPNFCEEYCNVGFSNNANSGSYFNPFKNFRIRTCLSFLDMLNQTSRYVYEDEEDDRTSEYPHEMLMCDGADEVVLRSKYTKSSEADPREGVKLMQEEAIHRERTRYELVKFEELPGYLQGNDFLRNGYRANFSWTLCWMSIFRLHNETINIWTHLLGTLLFFGLMLAVLVWDWKLKDSNFEDKLVFFVFFFGAQCQMLFSTIFHTFSCQSHRWYKWFARLDYTGICMMIVGSYYPCIYYTLRCHPAVSILHLSLISIAGAIGILVSMMPVFQAPRFRVLRVLVFVAVGLYILILLPHIWFLYGFGQIWPLLWRLLIMGALYICGAVIYATRSPECCCPGKFDYGWHSHPIWHIFTIVAGLVQMYNVLFAYEHYKALQCVNSHLV